MKRREGGSAVVALAVVALAAVALVVGAALLSRGNARELPAQASAQPPARTAQASAPGPGTTPAVGDLAGRFVTHAEHIQPGRVAPPAGLVLRNPHEGDASAVATGGKLFVAYNCLDCHGADGSGAMGPSLADGRWHFGGAPAEVFESIYQGRPEGMPAWGSLISADQIWMLVSYVRSLEAGKNVTTENFTGTTVERTGH
jgi:mono/diheme cytochrome c family protein